MNFNLMDVTSDWLYNYRGINYQDDSSQATFHKIENGNLYYSRFFLAPIPDFGMDAEDLASLTECGRYIQMRILEIAEPIRSQSINHNPFFNLFEDFTFEREAFQTSYRVKTSKYPITLSEIFCAMEEKFGQNIGQYGFCGDCGFFLMPVYDYTSSQEVFCPSCPSDIYIDYYKKDATKRTAGTSKKQYILYKKLNSSAELNPLKTSEKIDFLGVSKTFEITQTQKHRVIFHKVINNKLFYSIVISGIEIPLTAEACKKPLVSISFEEDAVGTFYKLLCIDEPIRLSEVLYLYEQQTGENIAKYGFCNCGSYFKPISYHYPEIGQYCDHRFKNAF